MNNHLTVCKQMSYDSFINIIYKQGINKSYKICLQRIWH